MRRWTLPLLLTLALTACAGGAEPIPTPAAIAPSPVPPTTTPPPTAILPPTATPDPLVPPTFTPRPGEEPPAIRATPSLPPDHPAEAILLRMPGPNSLVTSPLIVRGEAESTFEQTLVARLVTAEGRELALVPTTIQAELGQRGRFEAELPFEISGQQLALLQVFAESARDGGLTHLASVHLMLAAEGPEELQPALPHREEIAIRAPATGERIAGGTVRVEGWGRALFENTLVVDLLDAEGNTLAREAIMVETTEPGSYGPFAIELPYTVSEAGPARVVVRDTSPAIGATAHLASVEITLAP